MSKKRHSHDWPAAKKLCRLNEDDIAMAQRLGFKPKSLIKNIPSPKERWKQPVKYWIRELHLKRFGHVLGEKPEPPRKAPDPPPLPDLEFDFDIVESSDPSWLPEFRDDDVPF